MNIFGFAQRSPDCNGEVVAWMQPPELEFESAAFMGFKNMAMLDYLLSPTSAAVSERECWWGEGMAG